MPAKSQAQQEAAARALQAKRGEINPDTLEGSSLRMFETMDEDTLDEFASTNTRELPERIGVKRSETLASGRPANTQ